MELEPAREYGLGQGHERPAMDIPGARIELGLDGLRDNRLEREVPFGEHTDRLTLQVVEPDAPLDRVFDYLDMEPAAPGDYYVRVTQLDGGRAWSSPFWVGAHDSSQGSCLLVFFRPLLRAHPKIGLTHNLGGLPGNCVSCVSVVAKAA